MQLLFHPQLGSGYALKVEEMKSKQQTQAGIALNCVEHLGGHAMTNTIDHNSIMMHDVAVYFHVFSFFFVMYFHVLS